MHENSDSDLESTERKRDQGHQPKEVIQSQAIQTVERKKKAHKTRNCMSLSQTQNLAHPSYIKEVNLNAPPCNEANAQSTATQHL